MVIDCNKIIIKFEWKKHGFNFLYLNCLHNYLFSCVKNVVLEYHRNIILV